MEQIKHISAVIIATALILSGQIQAQADWSPGMHPVGAPNFIPNPGQPIHHEAAPQVRVDLQQRVASQNRVQPPRPIEVRTAQQIQYESQEQRADRNQAADHRDTRPGYFRRDTQYYGYIEVPFPADVDTGFTVPDGYEAVVMAGQSYYYNDGAFYQLINNQLVAIPPVLGAIVDSIPQDYQIIMADGVHFLFTEGVYYQRVDQGFEVVQPPASDLE